MQHNAFQIIRKNFLAICKKRKIRYRLSLVCRSAEGDDFFFEIFSIKAQAICS
jgi:hypothetical protein